MRLRAIGIAIATLLAGTTGALAAAAVPDPNSGMPYGFSPVGDDAVYFHPIMNQMEGRFGDGAGEFRWDGEAWVGTDFNKLWLKSEGSLHGGAVADGQHEVLYDRPVTTYFDLQAGLRADLDSLPGRTWAAFGIQGLAPYSFEVSATAYASDGGHYAAKLGGLYDLLITQRLILQPQIELNFYTKADPVREVGQGLSHLDSGLRLRYELSRKFAPYVGVTYESKFGRTADFASNGGGPVNELRFALGLRAWF